jgi:hypothetical protein
VPSEYKTFINNNEFRQHSYFENVKSIHNP